MNKFLVILFLSLLVIGFPFFVFASGGRINSTYKYAWSNTAGWINFAPTDASGNYVGVVVTDSGLTGDAWSQNYGWINFAPTGAGGVKNTASGVLFGSAWGENTGWIDFNNVTINSKGQFIGTASGSVVGTVNFACTEAGCPVTTDWLPANSVVGGNSYTPAIPGPATPSGGFTSVAPVNSASIIFARSLWLGMTGQDVKNLQIFLNVQGMTLSATGAGSPGNETTYFGQKTYNALVKFQKLHASDIFGLNQNMPGLGIFGPSTIKVVMSLLK